MYAFLVLTIGDINESIKKYCKKYKIAFYIHAKEPNKIDQRIRKNIIKLIILQTLGIRMLKHGISIIIL